jgi:putative lipoic acid-binding regulatory protein
MSEQSRPTLIEFPCDFPIKIMGACVDDFAQTVARVVQAHDPAFDVASMQMRPSRNGNYLALTCTVRALSQAQLDALYRELSAHPMVKVVL